MMNVNISVNGRTIYAIHIHNIGQISLDGIPVSGLYNYKIVVSRGSAAEDGNWSLLDRDLLEFVVHHLRPDGACVLVEKVLEKIAELEENPQKGQET